MEIDIANNIRRIRRSRGYRSASDLAIALCVSGYDCSVSTVKAWESGTRAPTLPAVAALCQLLDVTADELIFRSR